jgi:DNA-binding NtrC family response regulator
MPAESPTILVVDDERAIRELICRVLALHDYTVLEARNVIHALQLCQQYPGPIHLLLTDVLMPFMHGRDLAGHAQVLRPELRVLYISGYDGGLLTQGCRANEEVAFLQKPFGPDALLEKVRDILKPLD